jgi:hypothetical protein
MRFEPSGFERHPTRPPAGQVIGGNEILRRKTSRTIVPPLNLMQRPGNSIHALDAAYGVSFQLSAACK